MPNENAHGHLISWLDSCRQPSSRHRTIDGNRTVCGHSFAAAFAGTAQLVPKAQRPNGYWSPHRSPRKKGGISNYCKTCFSGVPTKAIPWDSRCQNNDTETTED